MAIRTIVIISDNVGAMKYIQNEKNGFLYHENFVEIVKNILNNKYDLNYISNAAQPIYDKLNWENVARNYYDIYQSWTAR